MQEQSNVRPLARPTGEEAGAHLTVPACGLPVPLPSRERAIKRAVRIRTARRRRPAFLLLGIGSNPCASGPAGYPMEIVAALSRQLECHRTSFAQRTRPGDRLSGHAQIVVMSAVSSSHAVSMSRTLDCRGRSTRFPSQATVSGRGGP